MTEHCMIDGKRCSKCCEVITLSLDKNTRLQIRSAKLNKSLQNSKNTVELMVTRISKRRAKKLNPFLVNKVKSGKRQNFFTCKNYKGGRCSIYDTRPYTCSGYPYYGVTEAVFSSMNTEPDYHKDCTYYIKI